MRIKKLQKGYKNNPDFYLAFLSGTIDSTNTNYLEPETESYHISSTPSDFPIYLGRGNEIEKKDSFLKLVRAISSYFISENREMILEERFWHSFLCLYKKDYLLKQYPEIQNDEKKFKNIVLKNFDWENYIYKAVLIAQYVEDYAPVTKKEEYYQLVLENLDIFNYIIKYEIFRNGRFLINFLTIIQETKTSSILKSKIQNRPDLGKDERVGRRIIFEFNKSYPIILAPMLSVEELRPHFINFLNIYYTTNSKN